MVLLKSFKFYNFMLVGLLLFMIAGVNASEYNNESGYSDILTNNNEDNPIVSSSDIWSDELINKNKNKNNHNFKNLQIKISKSKNNSDITLTGVYKYNKKTDSKIKSLGDGVTISKNLRIVGQNCTIDANDLARCLVIDSNVNVTLENITIINGNISSDNGGGICCKDKVKLTLKNCCFKNNKVYNGNGGALVAGHKCNIKIYNCSFEKNSGIRVSKLSWDKFKRGMGGALCVGIGSKLKIINSSFKKNNAYLSTILLVSYNDIVYKPSKLYVKGCKFENNTSKRRGVIYLDELGKGKILDSIFVNNHSPDSTGTLILDASKKVIVKNCRFISNTGVDGAAIFLDKFRGNVSHVKLVNCKFIGNVASNKGVIYSNGGFLTIKNCSFKNNKCKKSDLIYSKSGKVVVLKPNSNKAIVIAPKVTKKFKDNSYFKITIKRKNTKKVISNIKVKIKISTGKKVKTIYKKTNSKGIIKISTKSLKKGKHNVKITSTKSDMPFTKKSTIIIN